MNPYLNITFRTFTIWIMTAVFNGFLCGIYFFLCEGEMQITAYVFLVGVLSSLISIPGFGIFWIVMLISISKNIYGRALFRAALSTALILATTTAVLSSTLYTSVSSTSWFLIPLFIIFSAIASIMMHFRLFKKIL